MRQYGIEFAFLEIKKITGELYSCIGKLIENICINYKDRRKNFFVYEVKDESKN